MSSLALAVGYQSAGGAAPERTPDWKADDFLICSFSYGRFDGLLSAPHL